MSINKDFFTESTTIQWNGKDVCTVRGLTSDDISQLLASELDNAEAIVEAIQTKSLGGQEVDFRNSAQVASVIEDNAKNVALNLLKVAPDLIARLIAISADEPDAWQDIKKRFVLPLQVNILCKIAELTFVDGATFRELVGNVVGLVGSFKTTSPAAPHNGDARGSKTSGRKSLS